MAGKEAKFATGVAGSIVATGMWMAYPDAQKFEAKLEEEKSPLVAIKHYHWGMLAASIGHPLADGLGTGLIASEFWQENPFGLGKSIEELKGNITLTTILGGILLISKTLRLK